MKSINMVYSDQKELLKFISKNNLTKGNILIQIFTGVLDKNLIQTIIDLLKEHIPNVKIIGASTDGEIIDGEVTQHKIIINFNIFENTTFNTAIFEKTEKSYQLGKKLAQTLITKKTKLLISFTDGLNINGENYIKGIQSVSNVIIAGGLAGDNGEFKETFVFNENKIISKGCVGVSLESDILRVNNEFSFNWEGIGKIMHVTKAKENIVYEIDGKTPVELYRHYFGNEVAQDIIKIGVEFPLMIKKNAINVARAVIGQNEDGSLVFAGNLKVGDKVQFGYGNIESILKKDENLFDDLSRFDIESIFIYSCMARRRFLAKMIDLEIKPFADIADVSGFFTYGEFFSYQKKNIFLNQTMTVLVLSEKENKKTSLHSHKININKDSLLTLKALTNLVQATSKELMDANDSLEEKIKHKTLQLKAKNLELEYLYYHDSLTELPNKFSLEKHLNENNFYGSLLIDIKQFSSINDMYGELLGDKILKEFAKKLMKISKEYGCELYRVGADQFLTINFKDTGVCHFVKNEIFDTLNEEPILIQADGTMINIHLSVRISLVKEFYQDIKLKADLALNYAKAKNLDFIEYSKDLELEDKLEKEIKTISMVKQAIADDRVIPVFQKIQKKDGDTYECLVRIKDGDKLISPFFFLDTISHTNYYYDITRIMIEKSFARFENRKETISINFSFRDINNEDIIDYLIEKIEEYNMYSRVIIEILESENINNFDQLELFINRVKEYGVKIAIDDFGSGYSNFIYLAEIKPDFIKIDGSLIKNIDQDKNSFIITKHIHSFAHELGCKTIAEFIHNETVCNVVKELSIDGLQGYFIEEPTPNI